MGWKKILKSIRDTGQDALGTARDKLIQSIPFPSKEESDEEAGRVVAPLRPTRKKDQGRGRRVDPEVEGRGGAEASGTQAGTLIPESGNGIPENAAAGCVFPESAGASDNRHHRMNSTIEYVQEHYERYGSAVAATILTFALQSGGMQRLVLRLGGTPWNDDQQNHEEVEKYLEKTGSQAFLKELGISSAGTGTSGSSLGKQRTESARARVQGAGEFRVKSNVARGAGNSPAPRQVDATTGGNPRSRLEGDQFRPVKLHDHAHRRDSMGRKGVEGGSHASEIAPASPMRPPAASPTSESALPPTSDSQPPPATSESSVPQMPPTATAIPSAAPAPSPPPPPATASPALADAPTARPASPYQGLWNPPIAPTNADTQELKGTSPSSASAPPPSSCVTDLLKKALED